MADAPVQKVGVVDFLENHLSYKYKIVLTVIIVAALVAGFFYIKNMRSRLARAEQEQATLQQKFEQIGTSVVSQNELQSATNLDSAAHQAFGSDLTSYAKKTNSTIQSLTTALGSLSESVTAIQANLDKKTFAKDQNPTTGSITNYSILDSRTDAKGNPLPPLDQINLSYNPQQRDPDKAFSGTTWDNFEEQFKASIGQWESTKDGAYKTTLNLSRTILKPNPSDPTHPTVLGTENIPITGATTIYSPKSFAPVVPPQPRWSFMLGASRSTTGYTPAAIANYRLFSHTGVFAGTAANAAVFGISFSVGNH